MHPDDYESQFMNVKKAAQLAQGDERRKTYKPKRAAFSKNESNSMTLSDVLDRRTTV